MEDLISFDSTDDRYIFVCVSSNGDKFLSFRKWFIPVRMMTMVDTATVSTDILIH